MCAPEAHAGTWTIKTKRRFSDTGTSWDSYTNSMQPLSLSKSETTSDTPSTGLGYRLYPSISIEAQNGKTATADRTMTVTVHFHYNASNADDLPPKMVSIQMKGNIGGYCTLPPSGATGGSGSLSGTTGFKDTVTPPHDTTDSYKQRYFNTAGTLLVIHDNSKREADFTIGPITLTANASINSAKSTTYSWYPGEGGSVSYAHTSYALGQLFADAYVSGELTPYGLFISSNMEPSYKKVSNWSELPTKTDANGNTFVDGSQISPNTPAYDANTVRTSGPGEFKASAISMAPSRWTARPFGTLLIKTGEVLAPSQPTGRDSLTLTMTGSSPAES